MCKWEKWKKGKIKIEEELVAQLKTAGKPFGLLINFSDFQLDTRRVELDK